MNELEKLRARRRPLLNGPTELAGSSAILTRDDVRKILGLIDRHCLVTIPGQPSELELIAWKLRRALPHET